MGILPLEFLAGDSAPSHGLTGHEVFAIDGLSAGLADGFRSGLEVTVKATGGDTDKEFRAKVRLDTPQEVLYYQNGGILQYVLRQLLAG